MAALWLWWVAANAAGNALTSGAGAALAPVGRSFGGPVDAVVVPLLTVASFAAVPAAQWAVLRRRARVPLLVWTTTTCGGLLLAGLVGATGALVALPRPPPTGDADRAIQVADYLRERLAAASAGMGAAIGLAQWLVLRRHAAGAGWWVPANAVGALVADALAGASGGPRGHPGATAAGGLLNGAVQGAVGGAALVWLLAHRPTPSGPTPSGTR
jgi:hypothetical protein